MRPKLSNGFSAIPESKIERAVCTAARKAGWLAWKLTVLNQIGVPDRLFIRHGRIVFAEFKAPGERPRASQSRVIRLLKKHGIEVHVVDDIDQGKAILGLQA